jgi:phage terminase large subunit GpA-like protein
VLDTNWWKSFVHTGFLTAPGDPGSITLFGDDPERHSLFAAHLTAETYVTPKSPKGIPVDEWTLRPGAPDNEWLDCMVYAATGASMLGCKRTGNEFRGAAKVINVPTPRWAKKQEVAA